MPINKTSFLRNVLVDYENIQGIFEVTLPPINHCIGTKRLLGENYAPAICWLFKIKDEKIETRLDELCILLRSYIVLDDFMRDTPSLNDNACDYLENCLSKISERVLYLLGSFSSNDKNLWHYHLDKIKQSYSHFTSMSLFNNVLNKCSFVFLPFDLSIFSQHDGLKRKFKYFVKYFLFSLQLMDDFHDMEEDLISESNHNLYISGKSKKHANIIIRGRRLILSDILPYMLKNLSDAYSDSFNNSLIEKYFNNSLSWIKLNIDSLNDCCKLELFNGKYEDFCFSEQDVIKFEKQLLNSKPIKISDIRAETMHSI